MSGVPEQPLRGPRGGGGRYVGSVFLGLGVILVVVLIVASARGSTGGGFSEPGADVLAALIEVPQVASSPKRDVVSALQRRGDGRHPTPLVDLEEIRSGGPPPDGIPPIDRPFFEAASAVDFLEPTEPVVVLEVEGPDGVEVRAYPIQILTWHELVNDTVAGRPVTISFCPLCNSAVAYDRELGDGTVLDFGTSGSLYQSSLVMYDRQTESLWTHFDGRAVVGHLTGERLALLPMVTVAWQDFLKENPEALVLSDTTGFRRSYGSNPYPGYDDAAERPFLLEGPVDDRLRPKDRVAVARSGDASVTVEWDSLVEAAVFVTELGDRTVVFVHQPGAVSALDGHQVSGGRDVGSVATYWAPEGVTSATAGPAGTFVLDDTTTWTFFGEEVAPGAGARLEAVEHLDTFWFAIAAFDPDTTIVRAQ